jgi:2-methylisocitrate lyase-like PEP mutase family enzyme
MTPAKQLRQLLRGPEVIGSLGAHDVFSARLIEAAGMDNLFLGGFSTAASMLGLPDIGYLTLTEMADAVRRVVASVTIPVVADGDTGHGDLHNVARTVREFERAGAAGILLEDQVSPKRCGHVAGKRVIPAEEMVLKLKAALDARRDPDFVVIARTDARAVEGLQAALARGNLYGDTGADIIFVDAPQSREELEQCPCAIHYPLLVVMLSGGVTPMLSLDELGRLGYKMVVWPIETLLVTGAAIQQLIQDLRTKGRPNPTATATMTFAQLKKFLGLEEALRLREQLERR